MGGFGSGRREYASTPTVEACHSLSANELTEYTDTDAGTLTVKWGENTRIRAVIENDDDGEHVDALRFRYTARPDTDDATEYEYRVLVEYTEPHLGGVRPWFRCPSCGTRREKLYLPPRREKFACRECHELVYQSSRSSGNEIDRARQRYKKAFARADAENRAPHPNNAPYLPDRPKGMHHDTFEDLLADVREARREHERAFMERMRELAGVADGVDLPPPPE